MIHLTSICCGRDAAAYCQKASHPKCRLCEELFWTVATNKLAGGDSKKPLCFVVGPIGKDGSIERKHSELLLHALIKHVLMADEFGYAVKRADEDADPGMIGDRVVSDIIHADLVIADLFFGQIGRQLICSDSSAQRMRNPNSRGKYLQLQFTVEDKGSSSRQQSITRQASAQPNDRGEARNGQPQVHLVTVIPAVDWHHIDWVHEIECAEAATWTANELVARTLETAVTGREAATTFAAMQVLLDLDRLDGACDLRRVAIDGAGQDRLAPGALVRFVPVAAGDQDRDVPGLLSPHMDRRQSVRARRFARPTPRD
jgi:hypothetical protein